MSSSFRHLALGKGYSKLLLSVAATVLLAACSADSERFAENPSDADPVYTASVPEQPEPKVAESDETIASRPLANASVKAPSYDYSKSYKAPQYKQPNYAKAPETLSAPQAETVEAPQVTAGASVKIGPGMTLYSIARANNVTVKQLASANGIRAPYAVRTGQTIRIPARTEATVPAAAASKPFKKSQTVAAAKPSAGAHTVTNGDTLFSLGRQYNVSPYAIADANGLSHSSRLSLGQKVKIPRSNGATPVAFTKPADDAPKAVTKQTAALPETDETETAPATETAAVPMQKTGDQAQTAEQQVAGQVAAEPAASGMRWPVRGKVISGFGPKSNGLKNEGINIAVPEGTSVRAADSGVVAYAGNELKGYGNLVLIRHENGYVTAYAHAKELFVKRGDTVKRGDVIAKAGQTGSVSSPQLHFEVRKGATALDPVKFLASSTASN